MMPIAILERNLFREYPNILLKNFVTKFTKTDGDICSLSYVEIINQINLVGLQLCNGLQLKLQLKKQTFTTQELGTLDEQFGFHKIHSSSQRMKSSTRTHYKDNSSKKTSQKVLKRIFSTKKFYYLP
ncbi:hypothetical protein Pfo_021754 [Paulownia fortunei]|nr:hypothetical protein Pfo_021754 [Paulownia fortunei]